MADLARGLYRWRFLAVVLLPGAVLMALEIVSSRLLAPAFGNSVYVWGSIIGVFLAAMSAGYVCGGRARGRHSRAARARLAARRLGRVSVADRRGGGARWSSGSASRPPDVRGARSSPPRCCSVRPRCCSPPWRRSPSASPGATRRRWEASPAGSTPCRPSAAWRARWARPSSSSPCSPSTRILALLVSLTALSAALAFGVAGSRSRLALGAAAVLAVAPWLSPRFGAPPSDVIAERITPYQTLVVREDVGVRTLYSDGVRHGGVISRPARRR